MNNWLGPFMTADDALEELRRSVAEIVGADPNTWPDHKNAPLAIAAAVGLRAGEIKRLRAECEQAKQLESDLATAEQDSRQKQARIERLEKIVAAAQNLVKVKGRHHSEIAYQLLVDALKEVEA